MGRNSQDGRVVAKVPGLDSRLDPAAPSNDAVVRHQMLREYLFERNLYVMGTIYPSLETLQLEHRFNRFVGKL